MNLPSRPSDRRVQTVCLLILTLIAMGTTLALLQQVLVPFVLAIFFAQCLSPTIHFQVKHLRLPRVVAVSFASILGLCVVAFVGFLIYTSVDTMAKDPTPYKNGLDKVTAWIAQSRPMHWLGVTPESAQKGEAFAIPKEQAISFVTTMLAGATNILSHGAMVLLLMAFLLFGRQAAKPGRGGIMEEIESRVQRYISLIVFISILTGVLVGATLSILGVQFAALFGFLAFLLSFIPNVGSVIATLLPIPIIFLSPEMSVAAKLLAIIIPSVIQVGVGSFVQPKMLGTSLQLHPIVLLLSLLFFTMIWGVAGAFLATPLTAVIKIIFERIPNTRPLADALAGDLTALVRPIDTPDNVYVEEMIVK